MSGGFCGYSYMLLGMWNCDVNWDEFVEFWDNEIDYNFL